MNTATRKAKPKATPLAADYFLLILAAFATGLIFLKAPGLGDDFTYWKGAWAIHEEGLEGWNDKSFHALRWPIWGFCWLLQGIIGPGLASFYIVPFTYLAIGAVVVYTLGARIFSSRAGGWASALAFFLHPLLDTVIFRPMPDMAEGALIGVAVVGWIALAEAERFRTRLLLSLGIGIVAAILFSNRFTGLFVYPVLAAVALVTLWKNPRFSWKQAALHLGIIALTGAALFCVEGLIYRQITGDFLHSIHANMGAKGRKGTEAINVLILPFRFIENLTGRGFIGPFYFVLALIGGIALGWRGGRRGRAVVAWAVTLYLAYSCSLQNFFPPKPLLRDADRFLCSLAVPLSILTVAGTGVLLSLHSPSFNRVRKHPVITACLVLLFLGLITRRPYFDAGQIPDVREYMATVPDGSTIFTHDAMRSAAFLIAPEKATKLKWITKNRILHYREDLEARSLKADEFWFCRKITWLTDRQGIERHNVQSQDSLASYFMEPQKEWQLQRVVNVGGVPEFVFYKKRPAGVAVPQPVEARTFFPELPEIPFHWEGKGGGRLEYNIPIPESLRGKAVALQLEGHSNHVQAFRVRLIFYNAKGRRVGEMNLRPYFHRTEGIDFHNLEFPKEATTATAYILVHGKTKRLTLNHLYLIVE